jgi:ubiquinone/menaquinone biosynthesis C-methylase UbiE
VPDAHPLFAAVYDRMVAPIERAGIAERRARMLGDLTGVVLDVGSGTGANLPHYRAAQRVVMTEPDPAMRAKLTAKLAAAVRPTQVVDAPAERLPFDDDSFDAVACTLVLCTVDDPTAALAEARRVLKPGGPLVVLEHVVGTGRLATWQRRLNPVWSRLAGGCQLNRDTERAIASAGFTTRSVEHFRILPPWAPVSPMLAVRATNPG